MYHVEMIARACVVTRVDDVASFSRLWSSILYFYVCCGVVLFWRKAQSLQLRKHCACIHPCWYLSWRAVISSVVELKLAVSLKLDQLVELKLAVSVKLDQLT